MVKTEADVMTAKAGLPVREVARRIEEGGYRSAKSSVTVEGSVAGALSRDQLFAYVAPGVYALHVRPPFLAACGHCLQCICALPTSHPALWPFSTQSLLALPLVLPPVRLLVFRVYPSRIMCVCGGTMHQRWRIFLATTAPD